MAPSLCGSFLTNKRSLVAFTWTLTTLFTFLAFVVCTSMLVHLHTHYKFMESEYEEYQQAAENNQGEEEEHNSGDRDKWERLINLTSMESGSMAFTAAYTVILAMALILYGSTTIVGFTSLRGVYIAPCFSTPSQLNLGIFGGAIVFFANMLLVCAVIFGEVRVEDWREQYRGGGEEDREREERIPYEIERIATVLAVTCMFLAALYSIFAILLFLYFGSKENNDEEIEVPTSKPMTSIAHDPRRENFITMGESS